VKIRLHGTEDECGQTVELLESVMVLQSVSEPYPDRAHSVLAWCLHRGHPARWAVTTRLRAPLVAGTIVSLAMTAARA
jgi:hypothetical protein